MTVIAAVARDGRVVMAADTAAHQGNVRFASNPKIRRYGDVLLGHAGHCGLQPALRDLEMPTPDDDVEEWAQVVAEKITAHLADRTPSMLSKDEEGNERIMGELLLGHAGRLWYIDTNLAMACSGGLGVIGSGSDVAYGALRAALDWGALPETAAEGAVHYTCERNAGCALVDGDAQVEEA